MKSILKKTLMFVLALVLMIAIGFAGLTFYGWEKLWERVSGPSDLGPVTFLTLQKTPKPNQALVCPTGFCVSAKIDLESPTYALSAQELKQRFINALGNEQQIERVDDAQDELKLRYVQRSKLMKFPDTVRIEFIPIDAERSTLAIYSQSQIGHSDMGVNLERVKRWLKYLQVFERHSA
jgi:uncharacterized protein (DUF1499 family)